MRADTVAEAVAAHYNISKSQLLDKEAAGDAGFDAESFCIPRASFIQNLSSTGRLRRRNS